MNTKQKILDVSLKLFSENGYESVSIRQICGYVKIKESSIYYHFKNKKSILDELINMFEEKVNNMMNELEKSLNNNIHFNNDSFKNICNIFFEQYLMDDFCNKILRLLAIEQLNNDEIQKKYEIWLFENPLNFQKKVFSKLINLQVIKNNDSEYLAIKYYSPIFYYTERWLLSGTLTDYKKEKFCLNAYKHIHSFFKELYIYEGIDYK